MIAELGEKDSDGIITLEQLAEYLHVSMATVRRDVDELASRGVLQKTRGGVILQARNRLAGPDIRHAALGEHG